VSNITYKKFFKKNRKLFSSIATAEVSSTLLLAGQFGKEREKKQLQFSFNWYFVRTRKIIDQFEF
jgi:hypothetical protein